MLAEGATSEGDGAEGADIEQEMDAAEQSAAAADAVQGGETERYFLPLRLACESKVARVMEVQPSPCSLHDGSVCPRPLWSCSPRRWLCTASKS